MQLSRAVPAPPRPRRRAGPRGVGGPRLECPAGGSASDGTAGIGDPYFPLDGNGGIDVLHYDVRDRYGLADRRLSGRTTLTVRATSR